MLGDTADHTINKSKSMSRTSVQNEASQQSTIVSFIFIGFIEPREPGDFTVLVRSHRVAMETASTTTDEGDQKI